MEQHITLTERCERERLDIVAVLLFLQGSFALLGVLGLLVLSAALGIPPAGTILLALSGPVLPLLGAGVAAGWRWARRGAVIYEFVSLAGFAINFLLALLPQVQMEMGLVVLLTNAALPARRRSPRVDVGRAETCTDCQSILV